MKFLVMLTALLTFQYSVASPFDTIMERAMAGDAFAQFRLGNKYHFGTGVPESAVKAFKWYHKAAQQGLVDAQFEIGNKYNFGKGVPEDNSKAVKWYRKAARQGFVTAQFNLGVMYFRGEGVPENNINAYVWWSMAKTQGQITAVASVDLVKDNMTLDQIAKGQTLASQCYKSSYQECY